MDRNILLVVQSGGVPDHDDLECLNKSEITVGDIMRCDSGLR
jgi:hypothetical protein